MDPIIQYLSMLKFVCRKQQLISTYIQVSNWDNVNLTTCFCHANQFEYRVAKLSIFLSCTLVSSRKTATRTKTFKRQNNNVIYYQHLCFDTQFCNFKCLMLNQLCINVNYSYNCKRTWYTSKNINQQLPYHVSQRICIIHFLRLSKFTKAGQRTQCDLHAFISASHRCNNRKFIAKSVSV